MGKGSSSSAEAFLKLEQFINSNIGPAFDPTEFSLELRAYLLNAESSALPLTVLKYLVRQDEKGYIALGRKKSPELSPIYFLQSVMEILPGEMRHMQFDYIGVVYKCYDICMKIAKTIKDEMGTEYKLEDDEGLSTGYHDMIRGLLKDAMDHEALIEKGEEPDHVGLQYATAADVVEKYFEGGMNSHWKIVGQERAP